MTDNLYLPDTAPKTFALEVVHKLRSGGFEAVWAGGCVRDQFLGIDPHHLIFDRQGRPQPILPHGTAISELIG